jgi:hypothetical protein
VAAVCVCHLEFKNVEPGATEILFEVIRDLRPQSAATKRNCSYIYNTLRCMRSVAVPAGFHID